MPVVNRKIEVVAFERERIVRVAPSGLLCPDCLSATELLTTRQAAALMQVGAVSVRRWLAEGKAHGVRTPGGRHRVCRASLLRTTPKAAAPAGRSGDDSAGAGSRLYAQLEDEDV